MICDILSEQPGLVVVDCVVPVGNGPSLSKEFDMAMLTFPGGMERTEAQFRYLLEASGFELTRITATTSIISVVEDKPA